MSAKCPVNSTMTFIIVYYSILLAPKGKDESGEGISLEMILLYDGHKSMERCNQTFKIIPGLTVILEITTSLAPSDSVEIHFASLNRWTFK